MARKPQKLINYNTSGKTSMPSINEVEHGEIVVRWNTDDPQLLIKIDDAEVDGGERFATFIDSGAVQEAISTVSLDVTNSINALSASVSAVSAYVVTSAATHTEVANASANAITSANNYTDEKLVNYVTSGDLKTFSGNVVTALSGITDNITELDSTIKSVSGNLETLSGKVVSDYSTTVQMNNAIASASAAAVTSANNYTDEQLVNYVTSGTFKTFSGEVDTKITSIEGRLDNIDDTNESLSGAITTVSGNLITLSGSVETLSGKVVSDYSTTTQMNDAIAAASAAAVNSGVVYTNWVSGQIETALDGYATDSELETVDDNLKSLSGNVVTLSGSVISISGSVVEYIDDRLSTVYTYKGSVATYDNLPESGKVVGYVYNVIAARGNVGDTNYTPAGTNYAWNGSEWDALGGTVDLSAYAKQSDLNTLSSSVVTTFSTYDDNFSTLSGGLETLSGKVVSDYSTTTQMNDAIASASAAAVNSGVVYTNWVSGQIETYLTENYATSSNTYNAITGATERITTLESNVNNISGSVSALSATTIGIETAANESLSAVTTGAVSADSTSGDTYASGVKIANDNAGRVATIDFSELVIDCGEF